MIDKSVLPFKAASTEARQGKGGDPNTVRPFPVGRVVWLNSGSAPMTVSHERSKTNEPSVIVVDWFDTEHFSHKSEFHKEQLTEIPTVFPSTVLLPSIASSLVRAGADTEPPQVEQTVQDTLQVPE